MPTVRGPSQRPFEAKSGENWLLPQGLLFVRVLFWICHHRDGFGCNRDGRRGWNGRAFAGRRIARGLLSHTCGRGLAGKATLTHAVVLRRPHVHRGNRRLATTRGASRRPAPSPAGTPPRRQAARGEAWALVVTDVSEPRWRGAGRQLAR